MKSQKCMLEKLGNGRKTVMVVLDGYKISEGKNEGIAPLLWALNDAGLVEEDEVLVLTVFSSQEQPTSPDTASVCCLSRENKSCQSLAADRIKTLQEEINRKLVMYTNIFKPYYNECKMNGVIFMLKIAVDYQPKAIIINEAKCASAKWIVMDRCFADDKGFQLSEINCNTVVSLVLVSDGEQLVLHQKESDHRVSKMKVKEEQHIYSTLPHLVFDDQPLKSSSDHASTSTQGENLTWAETNNFAHRELPGVQDKLKLSSQRGNMRVTDGSVSGEIAEFNNALGFSLKLSSWEAILEITSVFKNISDNDQNESFQMFRGHLPDHQCEALVKTFSTDLGSVLEVEKMVALSMHHKNILGLIGYHQTANAISLAFPYTTKGTLENFLYGSRGKHWLTFEDKMNIVTGIAQGLHYMHEECPQGPVVHGRLRMSDIFLNYNLRPQITGFRHARWLHQELLSPTYRHRCLHRYKLDAESLKLVKRDVLSFGILLLRLFCRKNIPQDNNMLVNWAQPLLSIHAYHEMLDEEEEYPDMYGMLRVMYVAAQCINARHTSRPCMSEVVSYLKGETSCTAEASPMLSEEHVLDHTYEYNYII